MSRKSQSCTATDRSTRSQKSVDVLDQLYHSLYYHQVKKDWREVDNVLNEIKRIEDSESIREEDTGATGVSLYEESAV